MSRNNASSSFERIRKIMALTCDLSVTHEERRNYAGVLQNIMNNVGVTFDQIQFGSNDNSRFNEQIRAAELHIEALERRLQSEHEALRKFYREKDKIIAELANEGKRRSIVEEQLSAEKNLCQQMRQRIEDLEAILFAQERGGRNDSFSQSNLQAEEQTRQDTSRPEHEEAIISDDGIYFVPIQKCAAEAQARIGKSWKATIAYHLGITIAKLNAWLVAEFLPAEMAVLLQDIISRKPVSASRKPWTNVEVEQLKKLLNGGASDLEAARFMSKFCDRPIYETSIMGRRRKLFREYGWQPAR